MGNMRPIDHTFDWGVIASPIYHGVREARRKDQATIQSLRADLRAGRWKMDENGPLENSVQDIAGEICWKQESHVSFVSCSR